MCFLLLVLVLALRLAFRVPRSAFRVPRSAIAIRILVPGFVFRVPIVIPRWCVMVMVLIVAMCCD
jgi:hypothetical protein